MPDEASLAQQVVVDLKRHGRGTATAAAYVACKLRSFEASLAPDEQGGISAGSPSDDVLIVKVVGRFVPLHAGQRTVAHTREVTELIGVYDEALHSMVELSFLSQPAWDVPSANEADAAERSIYADLRKLGSPQPLSP